MQESRTVILLISLMVIFFLFVSEFDSHSPYGSERVIANRGDLGAAFLVNVE